MKVVDLLESRRQQWRELEQLCPAMRRRWRRPLPAATMLRFAALYRELFGDPREHEDAFGRQRWSDFLQAFCELQGPPFT